MQIGLFGKLPAKGDFLTRNVPPEVLQFWEAWLEKVVGGAKHHLGGNWHNTYMAAPVWRFWIGDTVFGHPIAGVLSPAVDRVGRQFPLTLILSGGGAQHPASPLAGDGNEQWYATLDQACLAALTDGFNGDVDSLLKQIPFPNGPVQAQAEDRRQAFFAYGESGLGPMLQDVRDHDHQLSTQGRSYWWTAGNAYVGPAIIALNGMPDAAGFAAMLTGFGPPPQNVAPEPAPVPEVSLAAPAVAAPAMAAQQSIAPASDPWGIDPNDSGSWDPAPPAPPPPMPEPQVPSSNPWSSAADDLDEFEDEQSPFDTDNGWAVPVTPEPRKEATLPPQTARPVRQVTGIEDESPLGPDGRLLPSDPIEEDAPVPAAEEESTPDAQTTVPPELIAETPANSDADDDSIETGDAGEKTDDDAAPKEDSQADDPSLDVDEVSESEEEAIVDNDVEDADTDDQPVDDASEITDEEEDDPEEVDTVADEMLVEDTPDDDKSADDSVEGDDETSGNDATDDEASDGDDASSDDTIDDDTTDPVDEAEDEDEDEDMASDTDETNDTATTTQELTEEEATTKEQTDDSDLPGEEPDKAAAEDVSDDMPEGDESPFATADKPKDNVSGQKRGSRLRGLFSRRDR
jgi:type VI secretion system protein ImpM